MNLLTFMGVLTFSWNFKMQYLQVNTLYIYLTQVHLGTSLSTTFILWLCLLFTAVEKIFCFDLLFAYKVHNLCIK